MLRNCRAVQKYYSTTYSTNHNLVKLLASNNGHFVQLPEVVDKTYAVFQM